MLLFLCCYACLVLSCLLARLLPVLFCTANEWSIVDMTHETSASWTVSQFSIRMYVWGLESITVHVLIWMYACRHTELTSAPSASHSCRGKPFLTNIAIFCVASHRIAFRRFFRPLHCFVVIEYLPCHTPQQCAGYEECTHARRDWVGRNHTRQIWRALVSPLCSCLSSHL
jgi:hypothetical protein